MKNKNEIKSIVFTRCNPKGASIVGSIENPTIDKLGNLLLDPKIVGIYIWYKNGKRFYIRGLFHKEWKREQEITQMRISKNKKEREKEQWIKAMDDEKNQDEWNYIFDFDNNQNILNEKKGIVDIYLGDIEEIALWYSTGDYEKINSFYCTKIYNKKWYRVYIVPKIYHNGYRELEYLIRGDNLKKVLKNPIKISTKIEKLYEIDLNNIIERRS